MGSLYRLNSETDYAGQRIAPLTRRPAQSSFMLYRVLLRVLGLGLLLNLILLADD
jgi:hypothetical protein